MRPVGVECLPIDDVVRKGEFATDQILDLNEEVWNAIGERTPPDMGRSVLKSA